MTRETHLFMRIIAAVVVVAFGGLVTAPAAAAMHNWQEPAPTASPDSEAERLAQAVVETREQLRRLAGRPDAENRIASLEERREAREQLKALRTELRELDRQTRTEFARIGELVAARNLPPVIAERHAAAQAAYETRATALLDDLETIETADEPTAFERASQAFERIEDLELERGHQPFDPERLPFGNAPESVREPATSLEGFTAAGLVPEPQAYVASLALMNGLIATNFGPADPEYLSGTVDAQLTPAVAALAEQLGNDPIAIFNWVRNNIEFVPTYGSIQGSEVTLTARRGNAYDTASLLIALYRSAGIPARYVYGSVEIPAEQAMNWVGGVTHPYAAVSLLSRGGIPNSALTAAGQVESIRLEHVWVEAWVDFYPSRGAVHRTGDTWVPLDPSFKQYEYTEGLDLTAAVPFDSEALHDQILTSAESDPIGWVRNVDQMAVQDAISVHQQTLAAYVEQQVPDATVGEVFGEKNIIADESPIFAGVLPYRKVVALPPFAELPDFLRHYVTFEFYAAPRDIVLDNHAFRHRLALPDLNGRRTALVYEPASPADQAVIDAALEDQSATFPAYLVEVVPVLKLDGQALASGLATMVGTKQTLVVRLEAAGVFIPRQYELIAGDMSVIGVNPGGIVPALWEARTTAHDLTDGDDPEFTEELFHQVMLGYWAELHAFNQITGLTDGAVSYQLPSHGLAGAPVSISYTLGIPWLASYRSRVLDVKENRLIAVDIEGNHESTVGFIRRLGLLHSNLESAIFDRHFLMNPGYSMSAVTILALAGSQGQRLWSITESNIDVALEQITAPDETKRAIRAGVQAGRVSYVHERPVMTPTFNGVGYIIVDPETGSGAYLVSGGRNGNESPAPEHVEPVPEIPATAATTLMLRHAAKEADATFVIENGMIVGIGLVAAGGAVALTASQIALIVALIALVHLLSQAQTGVVDEAYDDSTRIFRHYTTSELLLAILFTRRLSGFRVGTFGQGVYGEEPSDPTIGCPMSAGDIAEINTKYMLQGDLRDAYVDIALHGSYWNPLIHKHDNTLAIETRIDVRVLYFGGISSKAELVFACD